jgi:HK97 family phage prohead protease
MATPKLERAYSILTITKASDDGDERLITGLATTPTVDRGEDIVEPEGAVFKLPIPLLWQHRSDSPIGHVIKAKVTKAGIEMTARIAKGGLLQYIDEAWTLIKAELVRGLSIGFSPIEHSQIDGTWGRRFTKWEWLELSAVTIPMNAEASISTIKSIDQALQRRAGCVYLSDPPGLSGNTRVNRKELT